MRDVKENLVTLTTFPASSRKITSQRGGTHRSGILLVWVLGLEPEHLRYRDMHTRQEALL